MISRIRLPCEVCCFYTNPYRGKNINVFWVKAENYHACKCRYCEGVSSQFRLFEHVILLSICPHLGQNLLASSPLPRPWCSRSLSLSLSLTHSHTHTRTHTHTQTHTHTLQLFPHPIAPVPLSCLSSYIFFQPRWATRERQDFPCI